MALQARVSTSIGLLAGTVGNRLFSGARGLVRIATDIRRPDSPWASIPPESARVVQFDGKQVAAYRDSAGRLHAVSAKCTHRGCTVEFNDAERTWDCPCHTARFSLDGTVVAGHVFTTEPLMVIRVSE